MWLFPKAKHFPQAVWKIKKNVFLVFPPAIKFSFAGGNDPH